MHRYKRAAGFPGPGFTAGPRLFQDVFVFGSSFPFFFFMLCCFCSFCQFRFMFGLFRCFSCLLLVVLRIFCVCLHYLFHLFVISYFLVVLLLHFMFCFCISTALYFRTRCSWPPTAVTPSRWGTRRCS